MYSDLGFLDFSEPQRTPFFSLQSSVPRFESGRRLQVFGQVADNVPAFSGNGAPVPRHRDATDPHGRRRFRADLWGLRAALLMSLKEVVTSWLRS